jgi:hypothetical protein
MTSSLGRRGYLPRWCLTRSVSETRCPRLQDYMYKCNMRRNEALQVLPSPRLESRATIARRVGSLHACSDEFIC